MSDALSLRDCALAYACAGWKVFPCRPAGKNPLVRGGFKAATCDEAQIVEWWARWPDANIGIATGAASGLFVADLDGAEGQEAFKALATRHGGVSDFRLVWVARTGKGRHLYFALSPTSPYTKSSKGDGLDIRADGGYVVAPPSVHPNGKGYEWMTDGSEPPPLAPPWLLDFARDRRAPLIQAEPLLPPRAPSDAADGPSASLARKLRDARPPEPWSPTLEAQIRSALAFIPAMDRDTWLRMGGALHELSRDNPAWLDPARQLFDDWSATCPEKFSETGQETTWSSFDRDYSGPRTTVASLFHLAKERGWRDIAAPAAPSIAPASVPVPSTHGDTILRLADLPPLEYDRVRVAEAGKLGIRVSTLDDEVERARPAGDKGARSGRALTLAAFEPWPAVVDGAALLASLEKAIATYVKLSDAAALAVALWVMHAHAIEAAFISPRLLVTSPEKRCGKTTLLRVVQELVPKALSAANITAAALFRTVEAAQPTLLIDEADTFLGENEELRGVINSGHARDGQVVRLVGDDHEPRTFATFCPTVIAAIGSMPGTIEDRSITIALRRRRQSETVRRLRIDRPGELRELHRQVVRWVGDNLAALRAADPMLPDELHDRAADNWRPLIAIADLVRGPWPVAARHAARELSQAKAGGADTMRLQLLADIRDVFEEKKTDRLKSEALIVALIVKTDRPWPAFDRGRPMTPAGLARLLKPFEIYPVTTRFGEVTAKGYQMSAFEDAFARYLTDLPVTADT